MMKRTIITVMASLAMMSTAIARNTNGHIPSKGVAIFSANDSSHIMTQENQTKSNTVMKENLNLTQEWDKTSPRATK